jgi:sensor histidine kinase regulating citrate/malate metabolism
LLFTLELNAPVSGINGLDKLEQACENALQNWGVASPAFLFALHEALVNAFEANCRCGRADAFLSVMLRLDAGCLTAEIPDWGPGLPQNWRDICQNQTMQDLLWEERGRGILFMQNFCQKIDSTVDQTGRHIMILKAGIEKNG